MDLPQRLLKFIFNSVPYSRTTITCLIEKLIHYFSHRSVNKAPQSMDLTQRRLKLIFWISSRLFSKRKIFFTWFFFEFNYLQGGLKISLTMLGVQEKFISFRSTTNYNITNFKRSNVNSISLSLPFICLYFHKMIIKVFGWKNDQFKGYFNFNVLKLIVIEEQKNTTLCFLVFRTMNYTTSKPKYLLNWSFSDQSTSIHFSN